MLRRDGDFFLFGTAILIPRPGDLRMNDANPAATLAAGPKILICQAETTGFLSQPRRLLAF